jgi:putative RecB family exonuclease
LRTLANCRPLAKQIWDEKWAEEAMKVVDGFKVTYKIVSLSDAEALNKFRWAAWFCVENLWNLEDPQKLEPTGLEYELNGEIAGVRLRGFIDRYSQTEGKMSLTVSDYKTGKTPKYDLDEKFSQLLIYAKLLINLGVGDVDKVELLYLKDGVKLTREVTHSEIVKLEEMIQETKSQIDEKCRTGEFEAKTSFLCNFCSYKRICPAWR